MAIIKTANTTLFNLNQYPFSMKWLHVSTHIERSSGQHEGKKRQRPLLVG